MSYRTGVLLTNIGSPDAPNVSAVWAYLKKFLSDKRVVELPRLIWWPILYGFILPFRAKKSALLYQKIWTETGSPLTFFSEKLAHALQQELQIPVALGMHYGHPTLDAAFAKLQQHNVNKIIVLPLYPQYSASTTAVSFDQMARIFHSCRLLPSFHFIRDYHQEVAYINALCQSIESYSIEHLLFSFHGLPLRSIKKGDPYLKQCHETVALIVKQLKWPKEKYSISFQSRLGRAKWLTPYTDELLKKLPLQGIKNLHVICPGFAVDCLETLEEIAIRGQKQFLTNGGEKFQYIPALNATLAQVNALKDIIKQC